MPFPFLPTDHYFGYHHIYSGLLRTLLGLLYTLSKSTSDWTQGQLHVWMGQEAQWEDSLFGSVSLSSVMRLHPSVSAAEKSSGVLEEPISDRQHTASLALTESSECDWGSRSQEVGLAPSVHVRLPCCLLIHFLPGVLIVLRFSKQDKKKITTHNLVSGLLTILIISAPWLT